MRTLNNEAMALPVGLLAGELQRRNEMKEASLSRYDRRFGKNRILVSSYMENIGWPELFGYDMNLLYDAADFGLEMQLRQKIFWMDNVDDDCIEAPRVDACVGRYFDISLFGARVTHDRNGVPWFPPSPIAARPDLALLPKIDFYTSSVMPHLLRYYERMCTTARKLYTESVRVDFPEFNRGPLDIFVQLRGYQQFIDDIIERPAFVHAALEHIANERLRWRQARRVYLGINGPADDVRVNDDWVNIPFISPEIFREFVVPVYRIISAGEAAVSRFHTCGGMVPIVKDLLDMFPKIRALDVSAWNDFEELDRLVDPSVAFELNMKNTLVLAGSPTEQSDVLRRVMQVARRRSVGICVQAIVRMHPTYEETLDKVNVFIELARETFAGNR